MFNLGNFAVKEIITGVAQDFNDNLLYTLDQLTNASIEITAESTDITDKNGTIIKSVFNAKTGELSATSALLSPQLFNASSGSAMNVASTSNLITMPKIQFVTAGSSVSVADAKEGTIQVMGIYNNQANGAVLTQGTTAVVDKTYALDTATNTLTVPGAADGAPTQYVITYKRDADSGIELVNYSNVFPDTIRLTLYAAIADPCSDKYRAAYIYIPSFQPDPSVTISLDAESTETDYNGRILTDYCSSVNKVLYRIYFPDEVAVVTAETTNA